MRESNTLSTPPAAGDSPASGEQTAPSQRASATAEADDRPLCTDATQCVRCGVTIGPTDYRLSLVVTRACTQYERHFCTQACLAAHTTDRKREAVTAQRPREFSYCR